MPPKKIKQVEQDDQSGSDAEITPAKRLTAAQKKALAQAEAESTMIDSSEPVKKTRNVKSFLKQGQKKETPEELDGLRLFYESLCLEKSDSEMAARWCIQHGIFDDDKHDELVQKWGLPGRATVTSTTKKDSSDSKPSTPRAKKAAAVKKTSPNDDSEEDYKPKARAATKKTPTPKKSTPVQRPVKKQRTTLAESGEDNEDDDDSSSDGEVYTPRASSRRGSSQPPRRGKLESSDDEEETKTAQETTSMVDQE